MNSSNPTLLKEGLLASRPSTTFAISNPSATYISSNSTTASTFSYVLGTTLPIPNPIKDSTFTQPSVSNSFNGNISSAPLFGPTTATFPLSRTTTRTFSNPTSAFVLSNPSTATFPLPKTTTTTFSNPATAAFVFSNPSTAKFPLSKTTTTTFSNPATAAFVFSNPSTATFPLSKTTTTTFLNPTTAAFAFSSPSTTTVHSFSNPSTPTFFLSDASATTFTRLNPTVNKFTFPKPAITTFTFSKQRAPISAFSNPVCHPQEAHRNTKKYPFDDVLLGTNLKFYPPVGSDFMQKDGISVNIQVKYQHITTMQEYANKSAEELRLEDQILNKKTDAMMRNSESFLQYEKPFAFSPSTTFASSISTAAITSSEATNAFRISISETPILSSCKPFRFSQANTKSETFQFGAKKISGDSLLHIEASTQTEEELCVSKLLQGLEEMLHNSKHSDFVLNVKGKEFKVHKVILAAHSAVFSAMIEQDATEEATGTANINDFDPNTFSYLLNFLYTGKVENLNLGNVLDLYEMANKYQVFELRSLCIKYMMNNISIDSFCDILLLNLRHCVKELTEVTTEFFLKNSKEIVLTAKWVTFLTQYPIVGNELFLKALDFKEE